MSDRKTAAPQAEDDRKLATALKARDGSALAELYDRYGALVYALALKVVRVPGDAEEVTQEVFLYAWEKASMFDETRGSLANWLCTMARTRGIDRLRKMASQTRRVEALGRLQPEPNAADNSPEQDAALGEMRGLVKGALDTLSPEQRQVIEIAYFEGLSQSEIAERLNTPLGTIKTRIRQGMINLRTVMSPHLEGEAL